MRQYLDMLRKIYEHGTRKHPTRAESGQTVNETRGLPNMSFNHDLRDGFPLVTTRHVPWLGCVGELRTFLLGQTRQSDFEANGCRFWKPWANKMPGGNLGPVYGRQWNNHGQLDHVLDCLRNRPTDRRMVVSAWRPDEHSLMVIPPCHLLWDVTVYDGAVNLAWIQRSCDWVLGVPINIASYALLAHLLAKWAYMKPGNLACLFCDCHIYENQEIGVYEWLQREPMPPPEIDVWFDDDNDFNSWHAELRNWNPMPNDIDFGDVEV